MEDLFDGGFVRWRICSMEDCSMEDLFDGGFVRRGLFDGNWQWYLGFDVGLM